MKKGKVNAHNLVSSGTFKLPKPKTKIDTIEKIEKEEEKQELKSPF